MGKTPTKKPKIRPHYRHQTRHQTHLQTFARQRSISFSPTVAARDSFIKHALTSRPRKLSEIDINCQSTTIYNNSRIA